MQLPELAPRRIHCPAGDDSFRRVIWHMKPMGFNSHHVGLADICAVGYQEKTSQGLLLRAHQPGAVVPEWWAHRGKNTAYGSCCSEFPLRANC
jgi:hypothetical protein